MSMATGVAVGWRLPTAAGSGQSATAHPGAANAPKAGVLEVAAAAEAASVGPPAAATSAILTEWNDLVRQAGELTPATMPA